MTPIKIPTEPMAAVPIVSNPIETSADCTSIAPSITTLIEKFTELIIKNTHPNFIVHQAPTVRDITGKSVFLAGSIENGKAIEWQKDIIELLKPCGITVLNPRRDDWNSSLPQDELNGEVWKQIEWESDGLDRATVIVMFFDPNTISPITLLELGLYAKDKRLVVCCPQEYFRWTNVEFVCRKYGVKQVHTLEELANEVMERVERSEELGEKVMEKGAR